MLIIIFTPPSNTRLEGFYTGLEESNLQRENQRKKNIYNTGTSNRGRQREKHGGTQREPQ